MSRDTDIGIPERLAFWSYRVQEWWENAPVWAIVLRNVLFIVAVGALALYCLWLGINDIADGSI